MDALKLLKEDHKRIKDLLKSGVDTTQSDVGRRTEILGDLTREMKLHERREEELLYPTLKAKTEARDIVLEGYEEHHVANGILAELTATDYRDENWAPRFKVLKENIEHHIEEEEDEMFKKARHLLDDDQLEAMGSRMLEMHDPAS